MYLTEFFLTELASSQVFHYTPLSSAIKILKSNCFELTSTVGTIEEKLAPKGYPYFLSTTRTTHGGYHDRVGYSAAMFNLSGDYYNQRYKAGPVNYWGNRHNDFGRVSEAEDRIFSKAPTMPLGGVQSIHIYVKPMNDKERKSWAEHAPGEARQLAILAKQHNIPFFIYEDEKAWRNQDHRKVIPVANAHHILKGQPRPGNRYDRMRSWLGPWLELVTKDTQAQLSKDADKIRYNLVYSYRENVDARGLENDFANARKPGNSDREPAVKLIDLMQRNGWKSLKDFAVAMYDKWKAIANVDYKAKQSAQPVTEELVDEEELDEWSQTNPGIKQALKKKGYKFLGAGVDQSAYLEPGTGQILKIFGTQKTTKGMNGLIYSPDQQMFVIWAKYCKKNENNPFLPKFSGFEKFIFDDHTYVQIRMEKLVHLNTRFGYALADLARFIEEAYNLDHILDGADGFPSTNPEQYKDLVKKLGQKNLQLLTKTCVDLFRMSEQYGWTFDLHDENFMARGNTPIIVDPWVVTGSVTRDSTGSNSNPWTESVNEAIELDNDSREQVLQDFIEFAKKKLHITKNVTFDFSHNTDIAQDEHHTGQYTPATGEIQIYVKNRNMVDILRSVCHELVHVKQDQDGKLDHEVGMNDPLESEAHSVAGYLIKIFGKAHHEIFE